jgi:hypothetical protein
VKITLSIIKASAVAIICLFLLAVPSRNALGITTNLGTDPPKTISVHEIRVGFNPTASTPSGKALPRNLQTEKGNKSVPDQASNKGSKAAISEREASAAASAAAAALFGAAL